MKITALKQMKKMANPNIRSGGERTRHFKLQTANSIITIIHMNTFSCCTQLQPKNNEIMSTYIPIYIHACIPTHDQSFIYMYIYLHIDMSNLYTRALKIVQT